MSKVPRRLSRNVDVVSGCRDEDGGGDSGGPSRPKTGDVTRLVVLGVHRTSDDEMSDLASLCARLCCRLCCCPFSSQVHSSFSLSPPTTPSPSLSLSDLSHTPTSTPPPSVWMLTTQTPPRRITIPTATSSRYTGGMRANWSK